MISKQKVICDANAWFALGNEEFDETILSSKIFIPTWINIMELSRNPLILKADPYIINAAKKVKENIKNIINEEPFLHLTLHAFPDFPKSSMIPIDFLVKDVLDKIISGATINMDKRNFYRHIENDKKFFKEMTEDIMNGTEKIRELLLDIKSRNQFKKESSKTDKDLAIKNWVGHAIYHFTDNLIFEIDRYPWERIELFTKVLNDFFTELKLHNKMKIHDNDHDDFLNMVYVNPTFKYWTREKKWINRIKKIGLEEYLLEM